jgi:biotin carboxyl carrier protein
LNKLPQAICRHNKKPLGKAYRRQVPLGIEMPDIGIVTVAADRVCALPIEVEANVSDGDDIAFVQAMKMEIPVAAPRRPSSSRSS